MEPTMERLLDFLALSESAVLAAGGVFVRISALAFLVPGFGERTIPMRVKLGAALAFAVIVWPAIAIDAPPMTATFDSLGPVYAAEATVGLILGLSLRFLVFALQTAGTLIAQNLSLTQAFGTGVAPDPEATMGTILTLAAIALALGFGLHIEIAALLIESYAVLPFGDFPIGSDVAAWSTARVSQAFSLAVLLGAALHTRGLRLQSGARRHQPGDASNDGRLHRHAGDYLARHRTDDDRLDGRSSGLVRSVRGAAQRAAQPDALKENASRHG